MYFNAICENQILAKTSELTVHCTPHIHTAGVSTQLQSSGLVARENSTFRNLALAVSGPFMA